MSDSCDITGGSPAGTGFGANTGVNYQIGTRLAGPLASGTSYLQTATGKPAGSYSIVSNRIQVAVAINPGRFTFSADGSTPLDLGPTLGVTTATSNAPVVYELAAKIANRSTGAERTSIGLASADDGIQEWDLGLQLVNNGSNLDLYRRVDSACNPAGTDYNNVIWTGAGLAKAEVDLRLRVTDAGAESGAGNFHSRYEVFVNGDSVFASAPGDFRFESSKVRLALFDTAPSAGPVTYDSVALSLVTVTNPPVETNPPLTIVQHRLTPAGFEFSWASQINTNYSVLKNNNLGLASWTLATNLTAAATNTKITTAINQTTASYFRVVQPVQSGLTVAGVTAGQRTGLPYVDIAYDLADVFQGTASISVLVSTDGGLTYRAAAANFSGEVGAAITPGAGKHIVWNVGTDWAAVTGSTVRVKIVADRAPAGADLGLVPGGTFTMGDAKAEGLSSEVPLHAVNVRDFYAGRREVTKALWDEVRQWATNHGYAFENPGVASSGTWPVQQVSWFDAVKWCNARSEKEGFPPAYYTDAAWTSIYRTGEVNLAETHVRWLGAGYRLLTEAEWEKAARGGLSAKRFPWGDTITQTQANYWSTDFESYDVNGAPGPHPQATAFPNLRPAGSFRPSGYGLYDFAGNTWEWCWDYYGDTWYANAWATNADTRGPASASWGGDRVYRGGSGVDIAWKSRVANRADAPPRFAMGHFGFRVALSAGENLVSAESAVFTLTP